MICVNLKSCTTGELLFKFSLGQNRDQIVPDSTEKLFQSDRRDGRYVCDFGEGGVHAIRHLHLQKFSASHKELMSP